MSEVKVNKISPRTACGTVTMGDSGDTIALGCGASQTGFGRTGTVNWDTASIKTTGFTAVSGNGYFCDTADSGAFTLTLPTSPSAGDIVGMKDYNGNFATANLTIGRGGSKINGEDVTDVTITTAGAAIFLVYVDATQGWVATQDDSSTFSGATFIVATVSGACNTLTTSGNCKIATFTGPGTFTVCSIGSTAADNAVSYVVVAGGGAGGTEGVQAGGGGAGGFREYKSPVTPYTASPLDGNPGGTSITVTATGYPITVGGGGTATPTIGGSGSTSTFSTIDSAGGGGGGGRNASVPVRLGAAGGSGGGPGNKCGPDAGGAGNTPPTTPNQGFPGGASGADSTPYLGGGGGGATAAGQGHPLGTDAANGGAGATTCISASPVAYAGGGGSTKFSPSPPSTTGGCGGTGGGGDGILSPCGPRTNMDGTDNTGGGGGAGEGTPAAQIGGDGGSGVVIIRYKFQ